MAQGYGRRPPASVQVVRVGHRQVADEVVTGVRRRASLDKRPSLQQRHRCLPAVADGDDLAGMAEAVRRPPQLVQVLVLEVSDHRDLPRPVRDRLQGRQGLTGEAGRSLGQAGQPGCQPLSVLGVGARRPSGRAS